MTYFILFSRCSGVQAGREVVVRLYRDPMFPAPAGSQQGPAQQHRGGLPDPGDLAGAPPLPPVRQGVSPHRPGGR